MFGYRHNMKPLSEVIKDSFCAIESSNLEKRLIFACANPHSLVVAKGNPEFAKALHNATHLVTDGVGLYMVGRWAGDPVGPRITGSDYFYGLMKDLNDKGIETLGRKARVFFLGSSEQVLILIANRFATDYPNIEFCGSYSPPYREFDEQDNSAMISVVNTAKPDVLWVGMTAPKQELWVDNIKNRLTVPVIGSIGAVFDFFAGTYPRAPEWAVRLGLEWVVRLAREPKRMWRRNFVSTPIFLYMALFKSRKQ